MPENELAILDNQSLKTVVELGLVGTAALIAFFLVPVLAALAARRRSREPPTSGCCAPRWPAQHWRQGVCSLTFDSLSYPMFIGVHALVIGLIGAVWRLSNDSESPHTARVPDDPAAGPVFRDPNDAAGESITMDLLVIARKIWLYRVATLPIIVLTLLAALYVVAIKDAEYEATSNYILINPPPPPGAEDIAANPALADINSDNPFTRFSDQSAVSALLVSRLSDESTRQALSAQGVDPRMRGDTSGSEFSAQTLLLEVTGVGPTPEQAIQSAALVGAGLVKELDALQQSVGVASRYRIEAQSVTAASSAQRKVSSTLRRLVGVLALGGSDVRSGFGGRGVDDVALGGRRPSPEPAPSATALFRVSSLPSDATSPTMSPIPARTGKAGRGGQARRGVHKKHGPLLAGSSAAPQRIPGKGRSGARSTTRPRAPRVPSAAARGPVLVRLEQAPMAQSDPESKSATAERKQGVSGHRPERLSALLPLKISGRHYGDNLARLDLLFSSLAHHGSPGWLDELVVVARADEMDAIGRHLARWSELPLRVVVEDEHFPAFRRFTRPWQIRPWQRQQIIKLNAPALTSSPFVLTLDPDVIAVKPIRRELLLPGGRALLEPESRSVHRGWWRDSADLLDVDPGMERPGMNVTPALLSVVVLNEVHRRLEAVGGRPGWRSS